MNEEMEKKAVSFVEGNINYFLRKRNTPKHIKEQILHRMLSCASCTKAGQCSKCACPSPKLFFAPHKPDPNWVPYFLNPADWEESTTKKDLPKLSTSHPDIISIYQRLWN